MSVLLAKNATANIVQMVVCTLLVLSLYKFISVILGVEALGVWSVILASVSAARLSEFGLGASVTRFVALSCASGDRDQIPKLVGTSLVTLFGGIGLLVPLLYLALEVAFHYIFKDNYQKIALSILPYALVSFWLSTLYGVLFSALDGLQRMVTRSYIFVLGQVLFTVAAILLASDFGIMGLAYAQILQGVFLATVAGFILKRELSEFSFKYYRFSMVILKEMLSYGFNVQLSVLFMTMLDPITKIFITRYGGPLYAGYFEVANQLISRVRALITSANQAVIPHIASFDTKSINDISKFYLKNLRIVVCVSLPMFSFLILWSHTLSSYILGQIHLEYLSFFLIIAIAWMVNLFSSVSYYFNQGLGNVSSNSKAIGLMGIVNLVLGFLLGYTFDALGAVVAYAIAVSLGSIVLLSKANRMYGCSQDWFNFRENRLLICSFVASCLSAYLFFTSLIGDLGNYIYFIFVNIFILYSSYKHHSYALYIKPILLSRKKINASLRRF